MVGKVLGVQAARASTGLSGIAPVEPSSPLEPMPCRSSSGTETRQRERTARSGRPRERRATQPGWSSDGLWAAPAMLHVCRRGLRNGLEQGGTGGDAAE